MADQLGLLKQLQEIDSQLHGLRRALAGHPGVLERIAAGVAAEEAAVRAAEERLKALQVAQKEKDVDLQAREAQVRKLQGQLSQLKTNKEYTTMQHEISSQKADASQLEEEILKLLDGIEQATRARQEAQGKLAAARAAAEAERTRAEGAIDEVRQQAATLERTRTLLVADVVPQMLGAYERVLAMRDGLALVPLLNDACGGCYRRQPPQVINRVYMKTDLVTCESCNRILYFDEAHSKL